MNLYVATLYFEGLGIHYEYFTSLIALRNSLKESRFFMRGNVSEYLLHEEGYKFNDKVWLIKKVENKIEFTQIN